MIINVLNKLFSKILTRKHRHLLLCLGVLGVIAATIEALTIYLMVPILGYFGQPTAFDVSEHLPPPFTLFTHYFNNDALGMFILVATAYLLKTAFMCFVSYIKNSITTKIREDISLLMFAASMKQPYLNFTKSSIATLMNNATAGISYLSNGILISTVNIAIEIAIIAGIVIILVLNTSIYAIVVPIIVGTFGGLLFLFMRDWAIKIGQLRQKAEIGRLQILKDSYSSFLEIKLYGSEKFFSDRFRIQEQLFRKATIGILMMSEVPKYMLELLGVLAIFCFFTITLFISTSQIDFITANGLFVVAIVRLIPSINKMIVSFNSMKNAIPSFLEIETVLSDASELENNSKAFTKKRVKSGTLPINSVELNNISFSYQGTDSAFLQNINVSLYRGEITILVGKSGIGKTTLLNIIAGVIPANEGSYKINGLEVDNYHARMHSIVGYVPQTNELFNKSILENVAFDQTLETIDKKMAINALRAAGAMVFVDNLPNGVNSILSDNAMNLSGGQKQRICLARALYRQPDLLIFDEATNALDAETEAKFMKTVVKLAKTKLILIVSHDAHLQQYCDKKIELN